MDIDPRPGKPFYCEVRPHQIELVERPIKIDPEFKSLIPPLGASEREQLESNLLAEGCRDPLVVWKGHNILLDGHNRYALCQKHGIDFKIVEKVLPDRDAARDWLIRNQLGRRNLTPEAVSYFRGMLYEAVKAKVTNPSGKNQHSEVKHQEVKHQNDVQPKTPTSELLAGELKVGKATIERDARFARDVNTITEVVGDDIRPAILKRSTPKKLTKNKIKDLARQALHDPDAVKEFFSPGSTKKKPVEPKPFPYKVGEVCLVIASDEPQLRGRGGCWAIVSKVHEHSCDLQLWNGTAELIKPEHLKSMKYTPEQQQQMQSLCHRLIRLRACGNLEPAAHSILSDLGRKKQPDLTPIEEKLLGVLESEYGLKTTQEELTEVIQPDSSQKKDEPASVEVNTNEICVAFMSNLDSLSTAHIKAVGKAIAVRAPHLASVMATALAQSEKQAIEIVKAIALVYPEAYPPTTTKSQ